MVLSFLKKKKPVRAKKQPKRVDSAHSNAKVKTIEKKIEKEYNLPKGSVNITLPCKRNARDEKKVKSLRKDYDHK